MLDQLIHNGVIVPDKEPHRHLTVVARGKTLHLTPHQEEMVLAFARKKGTPYVDDPVFVSNFMQDWSQDLGIDPPLTLDEVDLTEVDAVVAKERADKEALTKEERKELAQRRREAREQLKARYGYAIVNGQRVELGTYMVEPSGIFMGRGQHPLRGRWKEGAKVEDITLNYGPNPEEMQGHWAEVVWQPESLWVARWKDKLTDKLKYIWLSDTAPIKQEREESKFDKAQALGRRMAAVRRHINQALVCDDDQRRRIATAVYLIDKLCLRVGDEKEADEADTVGATTLRQEHLTFHDDGSVEFRFLGKDSVEWHKQFKPVEPALENLRQLVESPVQLAAGDGSEDELDGDWEDQEASLDDDLDDDDGQEPRPGDGASDNGSLQLFPDVTSSHVNAFLSEVMSGLSAKVFRTHHATDAVRVELKDAKIAAGDPEYKKWRAASKANLVAAELCNHTKQSTGNWAKRRERYDQRIAKAKERVARYTSQVREARAKSVALERESEERVAAAKTPEQAKKTRERYQKRFATARRRIEAAQGRKQRAQESLGKIRAQKEIAREKRNWNTSTSLKSYIDPRVYYEWGQSVDYDVLERYYPATLRRKFAWVRNNGQEPGTELDLYIEVRPCLPADMMAVAAFMASAGQEYRDLQLPTEAADVAMRFLPCLGQEWRAARVVLGEEHEVLGFISVGPPYGDEKERCLDLYVVLDPDIRPRGIEAAVAAEIENCIDAYETQHPRKRGQSEIKLAPRDAAWLRYTAKLEQMLSLGDEPGEEDDDDED